MEKFNIAFSFSHDTKVFKLKSSQKCRLDASTSAILSISSFIIQHFPFLRPPTKIDKDWPQPKVTLQSPWEAGSYHPYFQLWNDIIVTRVIQRHALFFEGTLFVDIQLRSQDQKQILNHQLFEQTNEVKLNFPFKLLSIFDLPEELTLKDKKMAMFAMNSWQGQKGFPFAPRNNMQALFIGFLFNNQQWTIFDILGGQVPSAEELSTYSGVILPGSNQSALNLSPYIVLALQNLDKASQINTSMKILGVCFGHQALSKYYKSQVVCRKRKGGIQRVSFDQSIVAKFKFLSDLIILDTMLLSEDHEDFVTQVPEGFLLLAKSQSCEVQSLVRKDGRILSTQFHSDFFVEFTKVYQKRFQYYSNDVNTLSQFYIEQSSQIEAKSMAQSQNWLLVFRKFFDQFDI